MMKEEKEGPVNVVGDEGGVCTPQGFAASGVTVGTRVSGNPDMALIVNQGPEKIAAVVFTTSRVQVAPATISKKHIADGKLPAVVLNSGNVNACNGQPGTVDVLEACQKVTDELDVDVTGISTCSTSLIGDRLSVDIALAGVPKLCENLGSDVAAGTAAAEAILTTDLVVKQAVTYGDGLTAGVMGKGVGTINPSMATVLGVITTDASVSVGMTYEAIAKASEVTLNCLDIDGSTSTNDTIIILANGAFGVKPSQEELDQVVFSVCDSTICQMQSDVGGVTKRVSVTVRGTGGAEDALVAAQTIGRDNLFKCAIFGSDPNWSRVLAVVGTMSVDMDPERIAVSFNGHVVCRDTGGTLDVREVDLSGRDIAVEVDLGTGNPEEVTIRTMDLSHDYVHINLAYLP